MPGKTQLAGIVMKLRVEVLWLGGQCTCTALILKIDFWLTDHDMYGFGNGVKKGEGSATVQVVVIANASFIDWRK